MVRRIAAALGARTLSSVGWVTVEKLAQQALGLLLLGILAPLLGPRSYGVFSVAMVFVGLSETVLGEGFVEVLVTLVDYDQAHAATASLLGGTVATAGSVVLAALAPSIGFLFHDPAITHLIWVLAPLTLISVLAAPPVAYLRRNMLFKQLALRTIVSLVLGGTAGIVAALLGAGAWALALQVVVQRLTGIATVWVSVPFRLQFRWSAAAMRDLRPIVANIIAGKAIMFAGGQAPRLIIGYVLGPTEVGLYTLATRFLDIVTWTAVAPRVEVGRIELSRTLGRGAFTGRYSAMVRDVAMLAAPLLLGGAAVLPNLYHIFLDARWQPGVLSGQLMLLSGLPFALVWCFDAALLGARLPGMFRRMSAVQSVTTSVMVLAAAPLGLNGVCGAMLLRSLVLLLPYVVILRRHCGIGIGATFLPSLQPVLGAALISIALSLLWWRMPAIDPLLVFAGSVGVGTLGYLMFYWVLARENLLAVLAGILTRRS